MKERPILFSGPMVRALLGGRKTQTRRLAKFTQGALSCACAAPSWRSATPGDWHCGTCGGGVRGARAAFRGLGCPYGAPGDRLWVREAWAYHERFSDVARIVYSASERSSWSEAHEDFPVALAGSMRARAFQEGWRPSIHMPRWASRITLEVTEVRVERLQDISEGDALAEGIQHYPDGFHWEPNKGWPGEPQGLESARFVGLSARQAYMGLWEQINGRESLDANPWVWAVSFSVTPKSIAAASAGSEAA